MSIFRRMERATSRAADRVNAEQFLFIAMRRSPNGRPGYDPERPSWYGKGIFDETPAFAPIETGKRDRAGNDLLTLVLGANYTFSVDRYRHPHADKSKLGDVIELEGKRRLVITSIRPDGLSRIEWGLSEPR